MKRMQGVVQAGWVVCAVLWLTAATSYGQVTAKPPADSVKSNQKPKIQKLEQAADLAVTQLNLQSCREITAGSFLITLRAVVRNQGVLPYHVQPGQLYVAVIRQLNNCITCSDIASVRELPSLAPGQEVTVTGDLNWERGAESCALSEVQMRIVYNPARPNGDKDVSNNWKSLSAKQLEDSCERYLADHQRN